MSTRLSNNFLLYVNKDGEIKVDVLLKDENIWLTIKQMAELFGIDKSGISRHIKNIFETGELDQNATVAKIATVQIEANRNVTRQLEYFNLDMIISVGYYEIADQVRNDEYLARAKLPCNRTLARRQTKAPASFQT